MHKHITHSKCHLSFNDFANAVITFLRREVPKNGHPFCDQVTDNIHVINPAIFRVIA
jgi:hypothetical protein